jgi:hypothetical protein
MSVDPAAAAVAAAAASNEAALDAIITAELNALAADAQALQSQISAGDVVQATVLPPNGLTDLVSILGNRVAASLPPTLTPGDQITVQVTGFNGTQIMLQVLDATPGSSGSPATASSGTTGTAAPTPLPEGDAPPGLTSTTTAPATATTTYTPAPAAGTPSPAPGLAPPSAVFVAASVRPNAPVPPPLPPGTVVPEPPPNATPGTIPGAAGTSLPPPTFGGIEARLAATRAASVQVAAPPPSAPPSAALPSSAAAAAVLRSTQLPRGEAGVADAAPRPVAIPVPLQVPPPSSPMTARGFAAPPPIVTSRYTGPGNAPAPAATGQPAAPAPRSPAFYQDPVALVRALKLPVTPSNLAAAKLALDAPQRLPAALATLESALPESDDPRVTTLRTLTAFVGKIEPSSPQLATQIAAYVEHVVSGSEPQLAQLLKAYADEAAVPAGSPDATAVADAAEQAAAPDAPATASQAPGGAGGAPETAAPAGESPLPVVALAQIVERAATMAVSLKEQIVSLIAGPALTGRGTDVLVPAASQALSAVTAVQLAAAQSAAANPQTMSFAIPMWLGSGGYAQAQLAVDRDAPDSPNVPLDGDNFHIAFILDTKNLGTVAIDLRTVGRAFSLSVKTENLRTAQRFGDELSRLTDRLTSMRYQAKSVEAVVAGTAPEPETPVSVAIDTNSTVREAANLFSESA